MPATPRPKPLGSQVAVHRNRPYGGGGARRLLLVGALGVLAPLGYGIYRLLYAYTKFGPVAAVFWSRPWFFLAGFAALLLVILLVLHGRARRRFVAVYQKGLRLHLDRKAEYTWEQVAGIASGAVETRLLGKTLRTAYRAELYPTVGAPLRLDSTLENLPELLTRLKATLYPRLLPGMLKEFKEGKRLYFGALSISTTGLRLEDREPPAQTIPWESVGSVSVQAGMLVIQTQPAGKIRLAVARVPNLELLLQIIQTGVTV